VLALPPPVHAATLSRPSQHSDVPCTPPVRSFLRTDKNMTCDGCAVHSGFYDVWGSLETALVPELRRLRGAHPTLPLIAVGHSLGGAAITIAAYVLAADLGFPLDQLYTYGTPRVGNAEFAAAVTVAQKYRVTHHRDVVPHLPPEVVGFAHMAPELFYADETHNGRLCDGSGEDPDCSDQYYVTTSVWDHLHYWRAHRRVRLWRRQLCRAPERVGSGGPRCRRAARSCPREAERGREVEAVGATLGAARPHQQEQE
jgi:hypothetical protein